MPVDPGVQCEGAGGQNKADIAHSKASLTSEVAFGRVSSTQTVLTALRAEIIRITPPPSMHSAIAQALASRICIRSVPLPTACRSLAVFLPSSPPSFRRPVLASAFGDDSASGVPWASLTASRAASMGAPRAPEVPALPLREGQYPKTALIEYFQAVLRGPAMLRFGVTQLEGPYAGNTFADGRPRFLCTLATPPVSTVVSGTKIQIPAMVRPLPPPPPHIGSR